MKHLRFLAIILFVAILSLTACKKKDPDQGGGGDGEKTTYTIAYELNGGELSGQITSYDGSTKIVLPTPTKEGFSFGGWYDNAQLTGNAVKEIAKGSSGNKTFYALWVALGGGDRKHELNRCGFEGNGMNFLIKVLPVSEYDPFDAGYTGEKQAFKQAHQKDVEDAYNIKIVYSAWDNEAPWGPERVKFIKNSYIDGSFQKKNVYAITISGQWVPTLVKASCLAELYNSALGTGIFADWEYEQNSSISESLSVRNKVYGFEPGTARPDYFLYYNATKVAQIGMEDPTELWFKGEWTWSTFDQWVKEAKTKLAADEYPVDCGYAEFIIGAAPAQGNKLVNASRGTVMFAKSSVTSIFDKMKALFKEGYWDPQHGVQDVSTNFKAGKTLIHTGSLWFLKESTRFTPEGEDGGITFKIGIVPYPMDDNTVVAPYTEPYTYLDSQGNEVLVDTPLTSRSNETLTTDAGEPIYGLDLTQSNFLVPYTGGSCYSIMNYSGNGENGINTSIIFCILEDLVNNLPEDPADLGLTNDDAYRRYLKKKCDYTIDVESVMSIQDDALSYYELMEVLSMTVGDGSHFTGDAFWMKAAGMIKSEDTPATELKEIEQVYADALKDLGY